MIDGRKVSEVMEEIPIYFTSGDCRPHCPDDRKFQLVEELTKKMKEKYKVIDIDGVKVLFDDGWAIVRVSNTAPQLVVRWESITKEGFNRIEQFVREEMLKPYDISL